MISRSFNPGTPSRTIMLRQLPLQMEDQELRNEFNLMCIPVKDVRLVRNRETGQSRGFAFIEFNTVEEAQNWMTSTLVS
jgi:RNA recognition motif-containing protein